MFDDKKVKKVLTGKKSDTELIVLMKNGDMAAFDAIYNHYCHKLHRFVFLYLKQEEDAEEIVQEVFIKIWELRAKIDVYASFESFLFTIAYNATMSLLRKRLSEVKSREYLKSLQQIESAEPVIREMEFEELTGKVKQLLEQLTPRQQEIFRLSREEGMSHEEIASKLNISKNTVNNHLVNTMNFLRSKIGNGMIVNALYLCLFLS